MIWRLGWTGLALLDFALLSSSRLPLVFLCVCVQEAPFGELGVRKEASGHGHRGPIGRLFTQKGALVPLAVRPFALCTPLHWFDSSTADSPPTVQIFLLFWLAKRGDFSGQRNGPNLREETSARSPKDCLWFPSVPVCKSKTWRDCNWARLPVGRNKEREKGANLIGRREVEYLAELQRDELSQKQSDADRCPLDPELQMGPESSRHAAMSCTELH